MKFSEHCLRQWVNLDLSVGALAEQMTLIGLQVDSVSPVAGVFSNVVVGEVLSTKQHPDADKLTCCVVDVGEEEPLAIVCGARNVRPGIKVPVARVGALLPGDFNIQKAKLRGQPSEGMICSANELGLSFWQTSVEGIMELPSDAPVGEDFETYFGARDHVIDIEITPNRGDCLSIRGIARDLAASNGLSFQPKPIEIVPAESPNSQHVMVSAHSACPRYVGRVIRDINMAAVTPSWIQICLQRAGIRPINPVVDVCHFVMIELGQPMHGFDLSTISGTVSVREARSHESCRLLDEREVSLSTGDLVIADEEKVLALAGIMGTAESGVTLNTTDVFLESAFFDPKTICLSSRRHGISTDAAYRFERGVDSELQVDAIERATALLLDITGGQPEELIELVSDDDLPVHEPILLSRLSIPRLLGMNVPDAQSRDVLTRLGMEVEVVAGGWSVTSPSYRFDIQWEVDLIEEIARIVGYAHIPSAHIEAPLTMHPQSESMVTKSRVRACLTDRGYHESITYSFIDPKVHTLFSPDLPPIMLDNPLSQDLSVMRSSLWPGLLQALQMNLRHQTNRVLLFETGLCFSREYVGGELQQVSKLAMVSTGLVVPEQWGVKKQVSDFYDMKADMTALLALTRQSADARWRVENNPVLHPGRSAALYLGERCVGWLGELHPGIAQQLDIRQPVILGELLWDTSREAQPIEFKQFSKFPGTRRDLAVVIDESVAVGAVTETILANAPERLQSIQVFDVYYGENVENGKKSVALGLTFQDASRTLRDEEINEIIHGVVTVLQDEFNATLRA